MTFFLKFYWLNRGPDELATKWAFIKSVRSSGAKADRFMR